MILQLLSQYPDRDIRSRYPLDQGDAWARETSAMIHVLLDALEAHPFPVLLWAYTSQLTLGLVDRQEAPTATIMIDAVGGEYRISYPLPVAQALWPGARGEGRTGDAEEAVAMVLLAAGQVFPQWMGDGWDTLKQELMAFPWRR